MGSDIELPGVPLAGGSPDVSIRSGRVEPPDGTPVYGHLVTPEIICLRYEGVGSFLIRGGNEIVVDAERGLDDALIRNFVLGPAMASLLHQRGLLVLHASAVAVDGLAVLFLGDSEWGKSTIAAVCYRAGRPLVADDTTAVELDGTPPAAVPAIPRIKLWPGSMKALALDPSNHDRVHAEPDKRELPAARDFPRASVPIGTIYVLSEGEPGIAPFAGHSTMMEVVRHSYAADLLRATETQERHFLQCADLVARVPVRRLSIGKTLDEIGAIPALIAADLS